MTTKQILQQIDDFRPTGQQDIIRLSVTEQRNLAFELLSQYFDLHRHDEKARELQSRVERLLWWSSTSEGAQLL